MSKITKETRAASLKKTERTLTKRHNQVLAILDNQEMTAQEIATEMYKRGICPTDTRNNAAPRLTELEKMGKVEEVCKVNCSITNRKVAVYRKSNGENISNAEKIEKIKAILE